MDKVSQLKCVVCGSAHIKAFNEVKDHSISKETFSISFCNECGFRFTDNPPREADCGAYYKSDAYISHSDTRKGFVSYLYHMVRNIMLLRKASMLQKLGGVKSVLDVGSGTGYFPNKMREVGFETVAVEPELSARKYSKEKFGLQVESPEWIFSDHNMKFGFITLWHVIEHIYHPDRYFEKFNDMLLPNGHLIIAIPNCNSYDSGFYQNYWAAYDVPRHLWHFNTETFTKFAGKHGFNVCEMKSMPFDSFYNCILSEKYKGDSLSFIKGMMRGFIAFLVGETNVKKASSVVYVLRKK